MKMNASTGDPSLFSPGTKEKQLLLLFSERVAGLDSHVAKAPTAKQAAMEGRQMKAVLGTEAED